MRNKANWQAGRTVREGGGSFEDSLGYISLVVDDESLGAPDEGEWVSPVGAVQVGSAKNFSYVNGKIVYDGEGIALVRMRNYQAITVGGLFSADCEGSGGLNDQVCLNFAMPASGAFGGAIRADNECRFEMTSGDTLDAYVRQTSEGDGAAIQMIKGVYHIDIIAII